MDISDKLKILEDKYFIEQDILLRLYLFKNTKWVARDYSKGKLKSIGINELQDYTINVIDRFLSILEEKKPQLMYDIYNEFKSTGNEKYTFGIFLDERQKLQNCFNWNEKYKGFSSNKYINNVNNEAKFRTYKKIKKGYSGN